MIREVRISDAPQLQQINAVALGYDFPLADCQRQLNCLLQDKNHILLGFADSSTDQLIAYCHVHLYQTLYAPFLYNVLALAVLPDYQGQGIGRQLMAAIESIAKDNKINYIRLNSGSQRHEAHVFYQGLGFESHKLQKHFLKELRERDDFR